MMVNVRNIFFYLMLCTMMLSCTAVDDVSDVGGSQEQMNLVLSIGKSKTVTRQGIEVMQEGQTFRGLNRLLVVPFVTNGNTVTVDNDPKVPTTTSEGAQMVAEKNYFYWDKCRMMRARNGNR